MVVVFSVVYFLQIDLSLNSLSYLQSMSAYLSETIFLLC